MADETPNTLTLEGDISDLPEDDDIPHPAQEPETPLVSLVSTDKTAGNIELHNRKTMVGRDKSNYPHLALTLLDSFKKVKSPP